MWNGKKNNYRPHFPVNCFWPSVNEMCLRSVLSTWMMMLIAVSSFSLHWFVCLFVDGPWLSMVTWFSSVFFTLSVSYGWCPVGPVFVSLFRSPSPFGPVVWFWAGVVVIRGHPGHIPGYHKWLWICGWYNGCSLQGTSGILSAFQVYVHYVGCKTGLLSSAGNITHSTSIHFLSITESFSWYKLHVL